MSKSRFIVTAPRDFLWVLSNSKNDGVIDSLKRKNIHFKFSENGGKATKNKPSWYLKNGEENKDFTIYF